MNTNFFQLVLTFYFFYLIPQKFGAQAAAQQSVENTAENIDHILDNMFVQRPHPYQSATGLAGN